MNNRQSVVEGSFVTRLASKTILSLAVLLLVSACTNMGVEPWERDVLAKEEMQLVTDPVEAGLDDHIYFSKEASSGGRGFGGGGCGCN